MYSETDIPTQLLESVEALNDESLLNGMKEKFVKSQAYGKDKSAYTLLFGWISFCETITNLLLGYLPFSWMLSSLILEYFGYNASEHEFLRILVFMTMSTIIDTISSVPFSLYQTFHIEQVIHI